MENSPLALFEHEKFGSLRVVERKVQPWFVLEPEFSAKDIIKNKVVKNEYY